MPLVVHAAALMLPVRPKLVAVGLAKMGIPVSVGDAENTTLPVPVGVPTATPAIAATVVAAAPAEAVTSPVSAPQLPDVVIVVPPQVTLVTVPEPPLLGVGGPIV